MCQLEARCREESGGKIIPVSWVTSGYSMNSLCFSKTHPGVDLTWSISCFFKKFFNIYSFLKDRERQSANGEGAEKEGDTESEAGSRLRAVSTEPNTGLELMNHESS